MEFRFTPEQEAFRQEVRAFLAEHASEAWKAIEPDAEFHEEHWPVVRALTTKLATKGWLTLSWPAEFGGQGRSKIDQLIFNEETAYARAPTRDMMIGSDLVAPTLMLYGTERQKEAYLPRIADGTAIFCQGFSEPGAGSDLASLQLRAKRDEDGYVLNGSKIWTSGAHKATHCWLMARTDPEAPKHKGISMFVADMHSPGIEVRPILNMFGVHYFNQVFFDNVRVPRQELVGEENQGWYVGAASLDFERSGVARFGANRRSLEELVRLCNEPDLGGWRVHAGERVRQRLAELWTANEAGRLLAYRVGWMQSQGQVPNKEAAMSKLMGSEIAQEIFDVGMELTGMHGTLDKGSKWAFMDGRFAWEWMDAISFTIRAGTSEVLRNIIATRGLGLPRG